MTSCCDIFRGKSLIYERKFQILCLEREERSESLLEDDNGKQSLCLCSRRDRRVLAMVLSLNPVAAQLFCNCKKCDILDKDSD